VDTNSDLLKYAPERLVPISSRKLIEQVMRDGRVSADAWREVCGAGTRMEYVKHFGYGN
jgi:hypothetical protein